ncbi:MAG: hypothetical protein R3C10_27285 [Pirellulales bacterium]
MPETARTFWTHVVACELLTPQAARSLAKSYVRAGLTLESPAAELARRLVADGHLSRYHAGCLLRGQQRRFRFGRYVIWEPVNEGRLAGVYRARRDGDATWHLLRCGERPDAEPPWRAEQRRRWRRLADDPLSQHLYPLDDEFVAADHVIVVMAEHAGQTLAAALDAGAFVDADDTVRVAGALAAALARLDAAGVCYGALDVGNVWCAPVDGGHESIWLLGPPLVDLADGSDAQQRALAWRHDAGVLAEWLRRALEPAAVPQRPLWEPLQQLIEGLAHSGKAPPIANAGEAVAALEALRDAAAGDLVVDESAGDELTVAAPNCVEPVPHGDDGVFPTIQVQDASMSARVKSRAGVSATRAPQDAGDEQVGDASISQRGRAGKPTWLMWGGGLSTLVAMGVIGWWLWRVLLPAGGAATADVDNAAASSADESAVRGASSAENSAAAGNGTGNYGTETNVAAKDVAADERGVPPAKLSELWRSPTDGGAIDTAYLPSGVQAIVAVRAAELWRSVEGERVVTSSGPWLRGQLDDLQRRCGVPLEEVEQVVVGFGDAGGTTPETTVVVRLAEPRVAGEWFTAWRAEGEATQAGADVFVRGDLRLWLPDAATGDDRHRVAVVAGPAVMDEIVGSGGAFTAVSRELAALLAETDSDRQFTLVVVPQFLQAGGRGLMSDEAAALRELLDRGLGDDAAALLVSCHADDRFFSEIRVAPAAGKAPDELALRLRAELLAAPAQLRDYVERLAPSDYGRRLVMRLPRMVEAWTEFLRFDIEDRQVVMRSYLPAAAAHNLTLAGQVALLEQPPGATGVAAVNEPGDAAANEPGDIAGRLAATTSLSVPRESLHTVLEMLAEQLQVRITIEGADLEAAGITRNQSISIDARDETGGEILESVLRLADGAGRLVYVVRESVGTGTGEVVVTTRAAAERRGDTVAGPVAADIE